MGVNKAEEHRREGIVAMAKKSVREILLAAEKDYGRSFRSKRVFARVVEEVVAEYAKPSGRKPKASEVPQ